MSSPYGPINPNLPGGMFNPIHVAQPIPNPAQYAQLHPEVAQGSPAWQAAHPAAGHAAAAPHAHVAAAHFGLLHIIGAIFMVLLTIIGFIVHVLLIAAAILLAAYGVKRLIRHLNSSVTS